MKKIERVHELPESFALLEAESKVEGFQFLHKMSSEWFSGKNRFDKSGETVYAIFESGQLIAIGGINRDPYTSEDKVGRVRHLYVLKDYRNQGLGSMLVKRIIEDGVKNFTKLRLRTDTMTAAKFYERIGFLAVEEEFATHEWLDKV